MPSAMKTTLEVLTVSLISEAVVFGCLLHVTFIRLQIGQGLQYAMGDNRNNECASSIYMSVTTTRRLHHLNSIALVNIAAPRHPAHICDIFFC